MNAQLPTTIEAQCQGPLINGHWRRTASHIDVTNPASGTRLASVASANASDTLDAIEAAEQSLPAWWEAGASRRSAVLRDWYDAIVTSRDDLAQTLTLEQGKPLSEALAEIDYAASYVLWFSQEAMRTTGATLSIDNTGLRDTTSMKPIGVCAAITPWNFPAAMITRKVAPSLAAGCSMVIKPSELTPLTALALGALALDAGVPAGVFNVVPGEASLIGHVLTSDSRVRKLSFTGSTGVGRKLMADCASTVKRLSLELGGNAPFIVFPDADIPAAVKGAIDSKFRNAGQTCICANRFLVHEDISDTFCDQLIDAAGSLNVGSGLAPGTDIGPLINEAAVQKVENWIELAVAQGARVRLGGARARPGSNFFTPTVLDRVSPLAKCLQMEIFGPVAPITTFKTEDEAINLANSTEYGLAAYVYTSHSARQWRFGDALDVGMLGINTGSLSNAAAPFGGVKQSGFGREGGREGIEEYLTPQYRRFAL